MIAFQRITKLVVFVQISIVKSHRQKVRDDMTVKELKRILDTFDNDLEVMTKKTEIFGNVAYVNSVRKDSYGFFGQDVPCVLLTDEFETQESEEV